MCGVLSDASMARLTFYMFIDILTIFQESKDFCYNGLEEMINIFSKSRMHKIYAIDNRSSRGFNKRLLIFGR